MEKKTNRRQWTLWCAGGMAALALLWGCLSPVSFPSGTGVPAPGGTSGTDLGPTNPDSPRPAAPGTGIAGEEFIVTLGVGGVGEVEGTSSRSLVGPGDGGIQYGGIRNVVQVIQVDAGTGELVHFQQEVRKGDDEAGVDLTVKNLWPGKRYHILVLTGHRERDYAAEALNPLDTDYVYFDDRPPTLLAAGLLADREIQSGEKTLSIPMQPLAVDTVFAYGGGTVDAALPTQAAPGGTALPAGTAPAGTAVSIVWTMTGGIETLLDAQAGLTVGGIGLKWGNPFKLYDAVCSLSGPKPSIALADNRITLDLGAREAGGPHSANFKLEYLPFGAGDMTVFTALDQDAASWIIRNGVNDHAQNGKTVFPNTASKVSPWNDKDVGESDAANGNGAVAFTFANQTMITNIELKDLLPAPVMGALQVKSFGGSTTGTVVWTGNGAAKSPTRFEGETIYTARVTLEPGPGFYFPTAAEGGVTVAHGSSSSISYLSKTDTQAVVDISFQETDPYPAPGAYLAHLGYFSGQTVYNQDSAIDIMKRAADFGSLSLKLVPEREEAVDFGANYTDIGTGLILTHTGDAGGNSPAAVTLDGGGKEIPLTGSTGGSVITVGNGVTLTLRNITFVGLTDKQNGATTDNDVALIKVETGGTLVLEDGAVITGNTNTNTNKTTNNGGGVGVMSKGTLVLENGAEIMGNTSNLYGGGVLISLDSTFTMRGGTISGNNATNNGGGVILSGDNSNFTMSGGTISGNETTKPTSEILYNGGGGVYVGDPTIQNPNFYNKKCTFTMSGGTISGNSTGKNGGGVHIFHSTFIMSCGTISGKTAKAD
jgi:hypothetical protein